MISNPVDLLGIVAMVGLGAVLVVSLLRLWAQHANVVKVLSTATINDLAAALPSLAHALTVRGFAQREDGHEDKLVLETSFDELEDAMVHASVSSWAWRVGAAFTGIALLVTFFLIGYVLSRKLGVAVQALDISGAAHVKGDVNVSATLAQAVEQMGSKFWISAVGIGCTLVHSAAAWFAREQNLRPAVAALLSRERRAGRVTTLKEIENSALIVHNVFVQRTLDELAANGARTAEGLFALSHGQEGVLSVLQQTRAAVLDARGFVESVDASLQGGLEPLLNNVEKLARNLLGERAEEFLARLDASFRSGLADVIKPLENLREDIKNVSPEQALRDIAERLQSAISGGASESANEFRQSMDELQRMLPEMLAQLQGATTATQRVAKEALEGFQKQLEDQRAAAEKSNDVALRAFAGAVAQMETVASSVAEGSKVVSAQAGAVLERTLSTLKAQAEDSAGRILAATARAQDDAARLQAQNTAQTEAAFSAVLEDLRTLRADTAATEERSLKAASQLGLQFESTLKLIGAEREQLGWVLDSVKAEARSLAEQSEKGRGAATATLNVAERLDQALKALMEHTANEIAHQGTSAETIRQIREGTATMEASLTRISGAVSSLLESELTALRAQSEGARKTMETLINKVDSGIVNSLATQVEELASAVASFEKAARTLQARV